MQVSEYSFTWLYRDHEERLTRELEQRRRELERAEEDGRPRRAKWFARRRAVSSVSEGSGAERSSAGKRITARTGATRQTAAGSTLRQSETAGCGGQVAR